jgi:hypothetical protein
MLRSTRSSEFAFRLFRCAFRLFGVEADDEAVRDLEELAYYVHVRESTVNFPYNGAWVESGIFL